MLTQRQAVSNFEKIIESALNEGCSFSKIRINPDEYFKLGDSYIRGILVSKSIARPDIKEEIYNPTILRNLYLLSNGKFAEFILRKEEGTFTRTLVGILNEFPFNDCWEARDVEESILKEHIRRLEDLENRTEKQRERVEYVQNLFNQRGNQYV